MPAFWDFSPPSHKEGLFSHLHGKLLLTSPFCDAGKPKNPFASGKKSVMIIEVEKHRKDRVSFGTESGTLWKN